jgi:type III secretory pathway lipoprotein EscJ
MITRRAVILCCLAAFLTVGCSSTPVADDVAQREANEIVAVLSKHNIQAQLVKGRGAKGRYSVVVQEGDFPSAAEVLSRLGLPADKRPSFQELTGGNGIIPPSREVESLRLDKAIASELEDIFRARSDVASVSVLVRMHSREANERPTVTVVVQSSGAVPLDIGEIREISRRAVPGIQADDIYVSVAQAINSLDRTSGSSISLVPFLGFWRVPAEDHSGLVFFVVFLVALSGALAGLAGYIVGQFNWLNKQGIASVGRYLRGSGLGGGSLIQGNSSPKARPIKQQDGEGEEEV